MNLISHPFPALVIIGEVSGRLVGWRPDSLVRESKDRDGHIPANAAAKWWSEVKQIENVMGKLGRALGQYEPYPVWKLGFYCWSGSKGRKDGRELLRSA